MIVELISSAMVMAGAALLLIGVIGLALTNEEDKEEMEHEFDSDR